VVIDRSAANNSGFSVGTRFQAGDTELTVVGVADNATYAVVPTAYLPIDTWTEVFRSEYPGSPVTPFNIVGVQVADGADAAAVASAINSSVPGVEALTRQAAADATPGVSSISQSFGLIVGITFLIVIVVIGFFFQILTVQKLRAFTVLKAVGATTAKLARAVSAQIVAMVVAGVLIGTGLLAATAAGTKDVFAISLNPVLITQAGAAVLAFSLLVGLFSIRKIARQDPASAAGGAR
jgi:putative ABC transport system permease protein